MAKSKVRKSKEVIIAVTPQEYKRRIARGADPENTLKPGRHVFRRGGFLERHKLKPADVRKMFKESATASLAPLEPMSAKQIAAIRERLDFSQSMFAKLLNVSPRTVQDWEQGRRIPGDAALKLLYVADKHPEALLDAV